jgi:MoxR-like ATPase
MASPAPFDLFTNERHEEIINRSSTGHLVEQWPEAPPWRQFLSSPELADLLPDDKDQKRWKHLHDLVSPASRDAQRGAVFRLPRDGQGRISEDGMRIRNAVNAAIHLRRPLLVTGDPGSGKTSLAYAIAWELGLGPVLKWPITARSRLLEDGLYTYDALGRLQDTQLDQLQKPGAGEARSIGEYITLGPVGTAFLPSRWPRVLLIDEIDKSDLQLPNELLQLFEEGEYLIKELARDSARHPQGSSAPDEVEVRTIEKESLAESSPPVVVRRGIVRCAEFPIVVMTSNRERDFPPAFNRRCLRVDMPKPTKESLLPLVLAHFSALAPGAEGADAVELKDAKLNQWISDFVDGDARRDRATDQLLNAIYLRTNAADLSLTEKQIAELQPILFKGLNETD